MEVIIPFKYLLDVWHYLSGTEYSTKRPFVIMFEILLFQTHFLAGEGERGRGGEEGSGEKEGREGAGAKPGILLIKEEFT